MSLKQLLEAPDRDIQAISQFLDILLSEAIESTNNVFSPRRLVKSTREHEPLPVDTRQLSSYRTRMGTILEYALSTQLQKLLDSQEDSDYLMTFASAHEYPDFYLRRKSDLKDLLKIEMKAVDAESDEQAARFDVPTVSIDADRDLLLILGWEWTDFIDKSGKAIGEYPHIFSGLFLPAIDIAEERDIRLKITGGKIEGEQVYVKSHKGGYSKDPGNYGKFWRIVHRTRIESSELSESIDRFIQFLREVDAKAPNDRF